MPLSSGVRRERGGGYRVRLAPRERDVLRSLPDQLRPLLRGDEGPDQVRERLFPKAYDDAEADREFRELIGSDLADQRLAAVDAFARTLEGGAVRRGMWVAVLDGEAAEAWLSALNDARLVLGQVLGIVDENDWESGPDRDDAASVLLYYLGWLQEELLAALIGSLDPDDLSGS